MRFNLLTYPPVRCIRDVRDFVSTWPAAAVTIGNFRSLHAGHRCLIDMTSQWALENAVPCVVMSFHPTAQEVLSGQRFSSLLSNGTSRHLFASWGVDCFIQQRIDQNFLKISAEEFVEEILLERLKARWVIIGDDFRFGHKRAGDIELLQAYERSGRLTVRQIPSVMVNEQRVSTTLINDLTLANEYESLRVFLGRPWFLVGRVVRGQGLGKKMGSPTLNLTVAARMTVPMGVFAAVIEIPGQGAFAAAVNIGVRPTVTNSHKRFIEAHLLDHDPGDISRIAVHLLKRFRGEIRFASPQELQSQIGRDLQDIRAYFSDSDKLSALFKPSGV